MSPNSEPRTILLIGESLAEAKATLKAGSGDLSESLKKLIGEAQEALNQEPLSVMTKELVPPSGDKHDYMSQSVYWWPNPDTEDGLPYISRDGISNPEILKGNRVPWDISSAAIVTLTLAYFFTDEMRYAEKAAHLIKTWYLNPATKMNPHLQFAAYTPGIRDGAGWGIVDSKVLIAIVDAVRLLEDSTAWSDEDQAGMEEWCGEFLTWLLTSDHGKFESSRPNNHGNHYDMQVISLALFTGQEKIAQTILERVPFHRYDFQIEHNGKQPYEISRTMGFGYSSGNMLAFFDLADFARHTDIDLWNYASVDGRSVRKALDFLIPFALEEEKWRWEEIKGMEFWTSRMALVLRRAAVGFEDTEYEEIIGKLPNLSREDIEADRFNLLYPLNF